MSRVENIQVDIQRVQQVFKRNIGDNTTRQNANLGIYLSIRAFLCSDEFDLLVVNFRDCAFMFNFVLLI